MSKRRTNKPNPFHDANKRKPPPVEVLPPQPQAPKPIITQYPIPEDKTDLIMELFEDANTIGLTEQQARDKAGKLKFDENGVPVIILVGSPLRRRRLWKAITEIIGQEMKGTNWKIHMPPTPLGQVIITQEVQQQPVAIPIQEH